MRRKFYIGFALVLIVLAMLFSMMHDLMWFLGLLVVLAIVWVYDVVQKEHSILRNFPVLGHIRFILEFFRPEIQQYFIADDESERPYDRETRTIIYERAKNTRDTVPFGTERDILQEGYEWILHSMTPVHADKVTERVTIGGPDCKKPYSASRLNISAMSFGALSANAILALNKGAKLGGFAHNTGEGGLSDYHLAGGGDVIFQLGTAYFGCRDKEGNFDPKEFAVEANRDNVKMIEIKVSQGAKPSHGGILPAAKLTEEIARIRKVEMGSDVMSPLAHTAFSTPIELTQFIKQLRELTGGKPIGFKLCVGRKEQFLGICKAMLKTGILPDFITVDGAEGGTGAAPLEYTNHVGTPLQDGLVFVHNALVGCGLRDKIRIIASGKVSTGFCLISKLALGADACNAARAFMMSTGCIQSRQCNANTCPTGVATQNKRLQRGLVIDEKKFRVAHYHTNTIHAFKELVGAMGLSDPTDIHPEHVMRRVGQNKVQSFAEIYNYLTPGALLGETIPADYATYWQRASADQF